MGSMPTNWEKCDLKEQLGKMNQRGEKRKQAV